jgi:hypothetical protein
MLKIAHGSNLSAAQSVCGHLVSPRCDIDPIHVSCRSASWAPGALQTRTSRGAWLSTGFGRYRHRRCQSSITSRTDLENNQDSRSESASAPPASLLMTRGQARGTSFRRRGRNTRSVNAARQIALAKDRSTKILGRRGDLGRFTVPSRNPGAY